MKKKKRDDRTLLFRRMKETKKRERERENVPKKKDTPTVYKTLRSSLRHMLWPRQFHGEIDMAVALRQSSLADDINVR